MGALSKCQDERAVQTVETVSLQVDWESSSKCFATRNLWLPCFGIEEMLTEFNEHRMTITSASY